MKRKHHFLFSIFILLNLQVVRAQSVCWMKPGNFTLTCPGFVYFYDRQIDTTAGPGGLACGTGSAKNYMDFTDVTETFFTSNGQCFRDSFILPALNTLICTGDTLYIYDGPNVFSPLIRKISTGGSTVNFTSSGPNLTFRFKSDLTTNAKGWQMILRCVPCAAAPLNDDCANATTLASGSTCLQTPGFINSPATPSPTTPSCFGIPNGNDDVWYSFTAANAIDTIRVQGSAPMDPVVQLLSGSCASLTSLQCANATGAGGTETLTASGLIIGQTYYIRIFDYNGAGGFGSFNFNVCVIGKANTDCLGAIHFCSASPYSGVFTSNAFGVQEYSAGTFGCITFGESTSAWFFWQCQTAGTLGFNISSSNGSYQDIDFALWGHMNWMICPMSSQPIRCSYSGPFIANPYGMPAYSTGLQAAELDVSEPAGFPPGNNGFIDTVHMKAGKWYVLMMNLWTGNLNYNLTFQLTNGATFNNCLLPIELTSFEGENLGAVNRIFWNTETELNNDHFTLERSADGKNFTDLAVIHSSGNSSSAQSYDYYDEHPLDGINYYRLRQVDADGSYSFSQIISLEKNVGNHVLPVIYPNPTSGIFNVSITAEEDCNVDIDVCNEMGKVIQIIHSKMHGGENNFPVDLTTAPRGIYTVKIRACDQGKVFTKKLVKI